jgi:hypothetical protein
MSSAADARFPQRRGRTCVATLAVGLLSLLLPAIARAEVDYVYHWDLYEQVTNAPLGQRTTYNDPSDRQYRWDVDTAHTTRVSYNYCYDYSWFEVVEIPAHSQAWHTFTFDVNPPGDCVVLRGRSLLGTQYNRNGFWRH